MKCRTPKPTITLVRYHHCAISLYFPLYVTLLCSLEYYKAALYSYFFSHSKSFLMMSQFARLSYMVQKTLLITPSFVITDMNYTTMNSNNFSRLIFSKQDFILVKIINTHNEYTNCFYFLFLFNFMCWFFFVEITYFYLSLS